MRVSDHLKLAAPPKKCVCVRVPEERRQKEEEAARPPSFGDRPAQGFGDANRGHVGVPRARRLRAARYARTSSSLALGGRPPREQRTRPTPFRGTPLCACV
ncbi:hypothetical protein HPB50_017310 [Hyalomma asiaticum]|uniref:Uncharacterized protein n=1 Tax=Hyalomma asiaticum TaxID=266040 RepID=A0ACB7TJT2_HYAAI|nr:hypothetical protein HPB50_017310 [Hyalomma asiaticum]